MTKSYILEALTLRSKKATKELLAILPHATRAPAKHVAGMGYVRYIYEDNNDVAIAHLSKDDNGNLKLAVKI